MNEYDDDALSTDTVLRAIANNANPRHRAMTTDALARGARRMQLLDEMPLADAIDITAAVYVGPGSEWECPIMFSTTPNRSLRPPSGESFGASLMI